MSTQEIARLKELPMVVLLHELTTRAQKWLHVKELDRRLHIKEIREYIEKAPSGKRSDANLTQMQLLAKRMYLSGWDYATMYKPEIIPGFLLSVIDGLDEDDMTDAQLRTWNFIQQHYSRWKVKQDLS